ncbi:MAG: hypothetical protein JXR03_07110 [Cyclobacteriaceae bacterium]
MRGTLFLIIPLLFISCNDDDKVVLQENILSDYIELNNSLELANVIACAGGNAEGLFGENGTATSVFFYPVAGATDFKYFETERVADSADFSKYLLKELTDTPVFNGYLRRFNNTAFDGERMGIVSYKTPGKLHICRPIRQKTNVKPTEVNNQLVTVLENGVNPGFIWQDGEIDESAIYFQVISDADGNLISGTYTYDRNFTFYDLSNVVLNITDPQLTPVLKPESNYKFTMMGVSEDNWVNLLIEKNFTTD